MRRKADKVIEDIKENVKYLSQLGVESIQEDSAEETLREKISHCQECPLSRTRRNAVPGEGSIKTDLMFVGEAPGREEDIQGRPFVGRAGQLLTKIIGAMKYRREDVFITNIVKCRPPQNRVPRKEEIEKCKGYLFKQLEIISPKVIVALGKSAADFFIHSQLGMTALRGDFYEFNDIKVMPTFHPSYLIRNEGNRKIKKMVWEDMKKVMAVLGKK